MSLLEAQRDCKKACACLGRYEDYTIDYLADEYCKALDARDLRGQNTYLSALLLRFWYKINWLAEKCKSIGLPKEEYFGILADRINYACKYRVWQDPTKHITAQSAILQCINTEVKNEYYFSNLQKNQVNYNNRSLDEPVNDASGSEDKQMTLGDSVEDTSFEMQEAVITTDSIIQSLINRNKIIEAITTDRLAYTNTIQISKKVVKNAETKESKTQIYSEFKKKALLAELVDLPENFTEYFLNKYTIKPEYLELALKKVRSVDNQKLYGYIKKTLISLRDELT